MAKNPIYKKLFTWYEEELFACVVDMYEQKGHVILHFLYFANVMKYRLLEEKSPLFHKDYHDALWAADFLCIDGIALQIFTFFVLKKWIPNMNGTDLTPRFLSFLHHHYRNKKEVHLYLYGWLEETMKKVTGVWHNAWYAIRHAQHGYQDFAWDAVSPDPNAFNVLLVGRGSPLQELFVENERERIETLWFCVLSVWWLFDFVAGNETRAPKAFVRLRVLETFWRIITNPKKNWKKFAWMFGIVRYWMYYVVHNICKKPSDKSN